MGDQASSVGCTAHKKSSNTHGKAIILKKQLTTASTAYTAK